MKYLKIILGIIMAAIVVLILVNSGQVRDGLTEFLKWVQGLGVLGAVSLALFYAVAVVFMVPASVLTLGAGFAFGVVWGTVTVSVASVTGATLAFLLGRTLLRDFVVRKVEGHPRFATLDQAVQNNGFKIVMLTRLSPAFPFTLQNYMYGLTKVSLKDYVLASWIGMLPGTVMYVYFGSAAQSLASVAAGDVDGGGLAQKVVLFIGLIATVAVTVVITKIARKALNEEVDLPEEEEEDDEPSPEPEQPATPTA